MAHRRVKAVGQFAWQNADLGVECLRCGLVTVYCDFEAADRFRERGWSLAVDDAVKRFRCRCGSGDVRLSPVPIFKRPRPVPARPRALRPIYREPARSLRYRGRSACSDADAVAGALDVLRTLIDRRAACPMNDPGLVTVLAALRPHVYRVEEIVALTDALERGPDPLLKMQAARQALNGIRRQLGMPVE